MLTIVIGNTGSGKGIFTTNMATKLKDISIIYSNYWMDLPNYHPLEPDMLFDLEPVEGKTIQVYVDEAYSWLESRCSLDDINIYMSHILFQSRKRNMDFILSAQLKSTIDKRFRGLANMFVIAKDRRFKKLENGKLADCKEDFKYCITNGTKIKFVTIKYAYAQKLFPLYKTEEKIMSPKMSELQFKMKLTNPEKLNSVVEELSEKVLTIIDCDIKKITMYMVKDAFLQLQSRREINASVEFVPYVYARIKSKQ